VYTLDSRPVCSPSFARRGERSQQGLEPVG
jgi:hypothetical protein